ncbi:MAG: TetR/AcrR family transcriptional regulator [Actinobacteria bacterium]|nr:TetR/AcrR family transcriptional regulator [Actinomycetota bacterium]
MVRWQPGAFERLRSAALELFEETGYEQATVAGIAARAGVTERTFYRYFADKREVLFAGGEDLQRLMADAVAAAPHTDDAARLVAVALDALATAFPDELRAHARRRGAVVKSQPALLEREMLKLESLKATLSTALAKHGVAPVRAAVAAESAVGVFHVSFARWVADGEERSMAELQQEALEELRAVVMWV